MDLMNRGISFVSERQDYPVSDTLSASSMIFTPGKQQHIVALIQIIGRLNGTVRPDVERRLYTTSNVMSNYINGIKNQEQYISEIELANGETTPEVIKRIKFNNTITRRIDRKKVTPTFTFNSDSVTVNESRMKHFVNLWIHADTIIGKIFRFVLESQVGRSEMELKEFIREIGAADTWYLDLHAPTKEYIYSSF